VCVFVCRCAGTFFIYLFFILHPLFIYVLFCFFPSFSYLIKSDDSSSLKKYLVCDNNAPLPALTQKEEEEEEDGVKHTSAAVSTSSQVESSSTRAGTSTVISTPPHSRHMNTHAREDKVILSDIIFCVGDVCEYAGRPCVLLCLFWNKYSEQCAFVRFLKLVKDYKGVCGYDLFEFVVEFMFEVCCCVQTLKVNDALHPSFFD
jgi:hypothetical protein